MHELHLAQNLLKIALSEAEKNKASKIKKLTIVLDKKEHLGEENLSFILENLMKNTKGQGAEIEIKKGEGKSYLESIEIEES